MKLLKFVNCDGPQTFENAQLTDHALTVSANFPTRSTSDRNKNSSGGNDVLRRWEVQTLDEMAVAGGYWLLDDNNQPVACLNHVLLATPSTTAKMAHNNLPSGITDDEIKDVSFQISNSQKSVRDKTAYGSTFIGKHKSKQITMDASVKLEKRDDARKRVREAVMAAVEGGEDVLEAKKRSTKQEKK